MPLYDYECDCGYGETALDKMTGLKIKLCPMCKKVKLHRLIGSGGGINVSTGLSDLSGESIWFPKSGKPYFDQGLRRTFNTPKEKKSFMDEHKIVSTGQLDMDDVKKRKISTEMAEIDKKKIKERELIEKEMGKR